MSVNDTTSDVTTDWQREIRAREKDACKALVSADATLLDELMSDDFMVNSPLNLLNSKPRFLELVRAGRIRHLTYESEIEHMSRHGDVVVVMGRDTVTDPPEGKLSRRRFTNVWRREDGRWRFIARHAHIVPPDAAAGPPR